MAETKRPESANKIPESTSKKVISFLNAAQSAEEIASAIEFKGERDVGMKVAESLLNRRARLGGFHSLNEVAATPLIGEVRFRQLVDALEARKESATNYIIEGQIKSAEKIDFAGEKLSVHAVINGIDVASAKVDSQGKYKLSFQYREQPTFTELHLLPARIPVRLAQNLALSKMISPARYAKQKLTYHASIDMMIPSDYIKIWGKVTKNYHMHGVVYATTFMGEFPISVEPLPAAKIEFFEVDTPIIWLFGTEPALTEAYLGYAYTTL